MQHEEYKETFTLDALDALEEAERCALYKHLLVCRACQDEWHEMRETAAALAYTVSPVQPPAELRARILERVRNLGAPKLAGERGEAEAGDAVSEETGDIALRRATTPPQRANVLAMPEPSERLEAAAARGRSMFRYGAMAASLIIAALGVALYALWQENRAMRAEVAEISARTAQTEWALGREREELAREREVRELLTAPDSRIAQLAGTNLAQGANARLAFDRATGQAMLVAYNLPPAPAGKAYQLWFIKDGKPLPGSVFKTDERGRASMRDEVPAEGRDASVFAVTLEREQGETAPKGQIYLQSSAS